MATTAPETTLCTFRKRFLSESEALFVQVLSIARQMKLLKLGTVALGGTKDPGRNYLVNTEGVPERRM